jgi:hypothetical protein
MEPSGNASAAATPSRSGASGPISSRDGSLNRAIGPHPYHRENGLQVSAARLSNGRSGRVLYPVREEQGYTSNRKQRRLSWSRIYDRN